ncbi:MAG: uroporphyrinogen decarboxylase [Flavobacteriales bacterium]|nr:uroporphyrinogen decarboxylase [Flavobacteriales bacterium]
MSDLKNDLILRAARGEKTKRTPVWLMRQAGRILPEYRAVRASLSGFKELVETPERAAEVTIQPVDILGVDAAIIFSDILVVPEAMGLIYQMVEKKGPLFEKTIRTHKDLEQVKVCDPEELSYVYEAIKITNNELNGRVPLIGFAGAPFTIFCYMVEGSGSKTFSNARKLIYANPELAHQLMQMITDSTIAYLKGQINAGAHLIQIFDSWASVLGQELYRDFSLPYMKKITDALFGLAPITLFAKGANFSIKDLASLQCNTVGLDWNVPVSFAREQCLGKTLQGNLDPAVLYSSGRDIVYHTKKMMAAFVGHPHIANLGHGVYPDMRPEAVKTFINTVKEYRHE